MLTRLVRWQLTAFAVVTVLAIGVVTLFYIRVPESLGWGTYAVTADFAASGGIYKNANVTYRGTTIGEVTDVELTDHLSVDVQMRLDAEIPVPADVIAEVRSVSAIGEQYVDLTPAAEGDSTEILRDTGHIDRSHTSLTSDVATLLREAQALVNSLDQSRVEDVLRETAQAFGESGPELARLISSTRTLVDELNNSSDATASLIDQAGPLLDTQIRSRDDIKSLADGLARFTAALRNADPQLRTLLQEAPSAADSATGVLNGISPSFPVLAANLANFGRIGVIYNKSIEQVLVVLPAVTAVLINAAEQLPADEGVKVDFKLALGDTPPCNVGFIPPSMIRSPGDETLRDLPPDMYCKVPFSSSSVVRGARNYPCQEFPGKRAPTVELCRDSQGYVPIGNTPWRGPPVPEATPITDPRNILPYNKFPYIPPGADYDPGPPVVQLPPGVPPGPGPVPLAPFPLPVPPVTPGPQPPPLPYFPPPDQQVPPYGQAPPPPAESPPPFSGEGVNPAPLPAEAPIAARYGRVESSGVAITTYDQHTGKFQYPNGEIGVFSVASDMAENWVDVMLGPRPL